MEESNIEYNKCRKDFIKKQIIKIIIIIIGIFLPI